MNIYNLRSKGPVIGLPLCFALIAASSLALAAVMLWLQPVPTAEVLECLAESGGLVFFLNFLPIALCMLFLFFTTGSLAAAEGLTWFAVIAMSVVNRFKMVFRYDPFKPWDVLLGGELLGIAKSFSPRLIGGTAALFLLMLLVFAAACLFLRNRKPRMGARFASAALTAAVFAFCNSQLLANGEIHGKLPLIGNVYNQMDQYNSKGFLYQFIYSFNTGKITAPAGYDKKKFDALPPPLVETVETKEAREQRAAGRLPHVFLILGEGFSELPLSPVLSYDGFTDPAARYRRIKAESDFAWLIVPNVGGGTADTEFDILTGVNTRQFRGVPYANLMVTKDMDALPRVLAKNGYRATSLHPGYPWFYNRQNVFRFLGFEAFTSSSAFAGLEEKGNYFTEAVTYDRVLEEFGEHLRQYPDTPLFSFVITIQNHGPYEDKYGPDTETNFHSSVPFAKRDVNALSNYLLGAADMDRELGRLLDETRGLDEPVVVAYFGDHLPLLSQEVYDALVPSEGALSEMRLYRLPCVIWANDAAKALPNIGWNEKTPPGEGVSSFYFGAMLLDYLGLEQEDPFFAYLNELKNDAPVILESEYFNGTGELKDKLPGENERLDRYEQWAYYRVFEGLRGTAGR